MNYKIVADSSANLYAIEGVDYSCTPMKIVTRSREFIDTPELDVTGMVEALLAETAPTGSSCPNTHEWLESFGDADGVFGVTITSNLSGSYASAMSAKNEYEGARPGAKVSILDSLSAGPELQLIVEKIRERILAGDPFEKIDQTVRAYMKHTHLLFSLKSLANLARNGRVSPAVAKIASVLGIQLIGKASDEGTLEPLHKCRGDKKVLKTLVSCMKEIGYNGGKVRIAHCLNTEAAENLKEALLSEFPGSDILIDACGGLCSYYAEKGGMLIGFESAQAGA